jgi:hemolysin III
MRTVETRSVPSRECSGEGFDPHKRLLPFGPTATVREASEIAATEQIQARVKPRLRGVFHEVGFFVAVVLAVPLTILADPGRARISAIVFSSCLAGCFGISALYHRPTWSPVVRSWLARADHAGVYLLIAGTYTPFGLIIFSHAWAVVVLTIVYSGVAIAIAMKVFWVQAPKRLSAAIGIALGWLGVVAYSQFAKVGAAGILLLFAGGLFYTGGAIVYALRRPDPRPAVFGYHEIFHLCTLAAAACQYAVIAFYVLPRG